MSNNGNQNNSASHCIGLTFAALLLRLWIGMRLLFAGLEKWKLHVEKDANGDKLETPYWIYDLFSQTTYNDNIGRITSSMNVDSPLPAWMIDKYASNLGYMLLIVGAWVIVGLASRASLIAAGFVFISLTFGLATIGADPEIVERGIEIGLIAGALALARYQLLGVDGFIRLAMGGGKSDKSNREKD